MDVTGQGQPGASSEMPAQPQADQQPQPVLAQPPVMAAGQQPGGIQPLLPGTAAPVEARSQLGP
eukprot:8374379-Alexandrium_andersonii.AAC.1